MGGWRGILGIQNRGRMHESGVGEVNDNGKGRNLMGKAYSTLEGSVKDNNNEPNFDASSSRRGRQKSRLKSAMD